MAFAQVGKIGLSLVTVAGVVFAVASCNDPNDGYYRSHNHRDCDYVDTRCNQVCDYYCDYYSCYPTCWDQCWDECGVSPSRPPPVATDASVPRDASAPPPPPASDSGTGTGTGVLCTSCISNSDCETGALCILRGGPPRDAGVSDSGAPPGRGFCGAACTTTQDCPDGFLCSQLGSSRQCLPTGNACD